MGWVDTAKDLGKEIAALLRQVITLEGKVHHLGENTERIRKEQQEFIDHVNEDVRELRRDFDEVRRRLARIEGTLDATFQKSYKEALLQLAREYLDKHGSLDGFDPGRLTDAGSRDS